ncbi:NDT-like domain-containing protein raw isoform X13 [Rhodnius prolixus]|uniref:NDT-like domain-containing protein raw isoform X13 n=1 Tax=Rhodnius prolixus TaxID=13249 RepID=UPI003D18E413
MSLRGRHLYPRNYPRNRRYTNIARSKIQSKLERGWIKIMCRNVRNLWHGLRNTLFKWRYTCIRFADRDVWTAWIRRVGSLDKNIPSENVPSLLSEMHLYPAQTQVGEMLECAKELAERGSHLTYGEFYNFASQIKRSHERRNNKQIGRAYERNGHEKKKRPRKMSKCNVTHDVFLGGSCNPTTWRQDVAIPLLESLGITYYNPQVSEWSADLVTVEHNAKESACILFYVLDRRTRNVVGIVEAANFAGAHRNLVLVMDSYREQEPIAGETITHTEFEELCSGLATLKDLVERQGIPVFTSITTAIHWTAEVYLAYHLVTNKKTLKDLQNVKRNHELEKGHISCCKPELTANHEYVHPSCFDLYIGGSCFDLEWKGTIAEPILKKSGLKYIMAECGLLKNSKAAPKEADIMENSSLLLFIITSNSRGLETMAIASFYIGRGKNVVICIQELNDSCCISNEKFSQLAMNDYNRGRIYLKDLACRKGVPVLESISDAVQYAVDRCIALPHTSTR